MKNCPNCNAANDDSAAFCSNCNAPLNGQPVYRPSVTANPWDHTADYDKQDIADTKIFALCCYLLSVPGILISLLARPKSRYLEYHIRLSLKFMLLNVALGLVMGALAWTVVVPIAGAILMAVLLVLRVIAIIDVCQGKAVDPWLIRNIPFLG